MNTKWIRIAALMALASTLPAVAQNRTTAPTRAETSLVGVRLMDTGQRVVSLYGTPDDVQAVVLGGTQGIGPAGGAGGRFGAPTGGPPGGFGGPPAAGGGGAGGSAMQAQWQRGFNFEDEILNLQMPPGASMTGPPPGFRPPGGPPPNAGGGPGGPGGVGRPQAAGASGGPGGPPTGFGGGAPNAPRTGGGGGATQEAVYTRWIYKRSGTRLGFVFDKFNRVVQIEAIGLQNSRVKTRRGTTFGANFASLIKRYGAPDGYEVGGDNLVVRYLSNYRVAFRLNRLGQDKPHVVTGIVVAAGR